MASRGGWLRLYASLASWLVGQLSACHSIRDRLTANDRDRVFLLHSSRYQLFYPPPQWDRRRASNRRGSRHAV